MTYPIMSEISGGTFREAKIIIPAKPIKRRINPKVENDFEEPPLMTLITCGIPAIVKQAVAK